MGAQHVFSFGGGATSFLGALKAIDQYGYENVDVINAALIDDDDYIMPVIEAFERVSGKQIIRISYESERLHYTKRAVDDAIAGNLTPQMLCWLLEGINRSTPPAWGVIEVNEPIYSTWHVDFEKRFMSNTLIDPCSSNLKRKPIGRYIKDKYEPGTVSVGVAMTADEIDRMMSVTKRWKADGYEVAYPLMHDDRYSNRQFVLSEFERLAGFVPDAYQLELVHNNCLCRKSGKADHARWLYYRKSRYLWAEAYEWLWRATFRKNHAILRDSRGGEKTYITMREFRLEMEQHWQGLNVLPGMEDLMFFGLEETPGCNFCEAAA